MPRPMIISILAFDTHTKSPIVILKEIDGERTLPIWIGVLEANAIVSKLRGIKTLRPMTHDLLTNIIELIGIKVEKVEICDLRDNTYYALIYLSDGGTKITIDARPSDALALSLRVDAPIFVADEVIEKAKRIELETGPEDTSERRRKWKEILEKLDPKDFGNT